MEHVLANPIKHLDAEIWELRPLRIDFIRGLAGWKLCLTASFVKRRKDTQTRRSKKPSELQDLKERG